MSPDEREQWEFRLSRVATMDAAIVAILDRVEQLEQELASRMDALRIARAELDEVREWAATQKGATDG